MQIAALGQDDVFSKRYAYDLSTAIFGMLFVFVILLFFFIIPIGNREIVYMTFGAFIGIVGTVAAFFFGSSSGSKEKSDGMMKVLRRMK